MKGIVTCQDCPINTTIYRFTGRQGLFSVPKKWCEECDLLVSMVKQTVEELGIESETKITVRPWFLWWWQPLLRYTAWHVPVLIINGKLISQGKAPNREILTHALTQNVVRVTDFNQN